MTPERFAAAYDFPAYAEATRQLTDLWRALYRAATAAPDLVTRARRLQRPWHLLALSEDWCGDAVNILPSLARLVESVPQIDLRILPRDANSDLMSRHLTDGTRSIPVVIAFTPDFDERGWWGPRPSPLQRWVRSDGRLLPKEDRYRRIRAWYARDRGRTALEEVIAMLERGERQLIPQSVAAQRDGTEPRASA